MVGAATHTRHARALADTSRQAWEDTAEVTSVLCLPDEFKRKKSGEKAPKVIFLGCGRFVRLLIKTFIKAAGADSRQRDGTGRPECI